VRDRARASNAGLHWRGRCALAPSYRGGGVAVVALATRLNLRQIEANQQRGSSCQNGEDDPIQKVAARSELLFGAGPDGDRRLGQRQGGIAGDQPRELDDGPSRYSLAEA
jgi:hypothetical protein